MISVPTVSEIRDQIISDIEGKIGQIVPTMPKAFFRVIATAFAGVLALLYRLGAWVYDQIFPQTAGAEALSRIGEQYGIVRTAAVAAELTASATGTADTTIPKGTLWQKEGIVYQQTQAVILTGGSGTISVEALIAGVDTNQDDGTELSLVAPISGVDKAATVVSTVTTGEDQESLEDYRTRIRFRLARRPQGGAAADYITWALEVAGIVKAFAFRTDAGEVTVYPLIALEGDRIPDSTKLAEVLEYVSDTERRPLCANVLTMAMTELEVDITVTTLQPSTVALKEAIESAWETWLLNRFPRQYSDEANVTNYISQSSLYSEAAGAGASLIEFTLSIDGGATEITYHQLADNEIVKLGTVTWPV